MLECLSARVCVCAREIVCVKVSACERKQNERASERDAVVTSHTLVMNGNRAQRRGSTNQPQLVALVQEYIHTGFSLRSLNVNCT